MKKTLILILAIFLLNLPALCDTSERVNIYYNNGVNYLKDKKYSSAIIEFKKVIRQRPYDKTVINSLGLAYASRAQYYTDKEKNYKNGINDLRSALTYFKYWDGEVNISAAQSAQTKLNTLKNVYAPTRTDEAKLSAAKALRAQGELAASVYEYNSLFNSNYAKEAYSTASDIYKSLNNDKMAVECIRNAISLDRENGMYHFKYALMLDEFDNQDASMDEFSKALKYSNNNKELLDALRNLWMARSVRNPNDSQALINLGAILQKQNELELAKAQYIKARQINPNDPVILINLASVYTALNDYGSALRIYDEIISKNPSDLSARYYKGKLFEKQGDVNSAIKQYKEILSLKAEDENAQNALNSLLSALSGDKLTAYLEGEALANPSNYDAQFKYAYEMHKNKAYAAAIEFYKRAIAINQTHPEPFINLAQIFILQDDYTRANNVINHGLSILPSNKELTELKNSLEKQNANAVYSMAASLYNNQDYSGALENFLKIQYQTPEILTMIGNCYYELKDSQNALIYYNKVLEKTPNDESVLLLSANVLMNLKREDEARTYLNKILTINPNNTDAKNTLQALNEGEEGALLDSAVSLYEQKRFDEALDNLNKLVLKNPNNAYAHYYTGVIYEEQNNLDGAIFEYKKSLSADPNFSLGYYTAAVALDKKENYKEALDYYDKYILLKQNEGVEDESSNYAKTRAKELREYLNQK